MNPALINVLLHAISYAPMIIDEVEKVLSENWNHPVAQNAVQALGVLSEVVDKVAATKNAPPPSPLDTPAA